jgi:type II secretory pathway component PulC
MMIKPKLSKLATLLFVLLVALAFSGCRSSGDVRGVSPDKFPVERATPPDIKVIELTIPRSQLKTALDKDLLTDKIRIVEIYSSRETRVQPLYRLFDVHPGSVYALFGLRNADVLVAANERYLRNPDVFKQYVRMLREEPGAQIEIMRGADPILFQYTFVD